MKKLVVMGLAMAMTASMVNGVCAQPVQAADGEGLKVALLLSGAANDQGWNQTAYEGEMCIRDSSMTFRESQP